MSQCKFVQVIFLLRHNAFMLTSCYRIYPIPCHGPSINEKKQNLLVMLSLCCTIFHFFNTIWYRISIIWYILNSERSTLKSGLDTFFSNSMSYHFYFIFFQWCNNSTIESIYKRLRYKLCMVYSKEAMVLNSCREAKHVPIQFFSL